MATSTIKKTTPADIGVIPIAYGGAGSANGTVGESLKRQSTTAVPTSTDPLTLDPGIYSVGGTQYETSNGKWPAAGMWGYLLKLSPKNSFAAVGIIFSQDHVYWGFRANNATSNSWYEVAKR